MDDEFWIPQRELEIIRALNLVHARYLVFGGYAVLYYGFRDRRVNDLDIWVSNDEMNASKVFEAFKKHIESEPCFTTKQLTEPRKKIDLYKSHYDVELFTSVGELLFDDAYSRKKDIVHAGENVPIISIQDLLTIKQCSAKECEHRLQKELKDIEFLKKVKHNPAMQQDA